MLREQRFFLDESDQMSGRISGAWRRGVWLICGAVLAACAAPAPPPAPPPVNQPLPEVVARFATPPARFIAALPETCTAPNQRIVRPAPGITECRMLMPPDATAGAILRYGGTISQLPETVIRLQVEELEDGVLLRASTFLEVPRAAGDVIRVVYPDPVLDRRLRAVMTELGGTVP
jgi:hypothetical protein